MRFLLNARIVVLDADPNHRALICSALIELGLAQILPAASLSEAHRIASEGAIDLCVVNPRGLTNGSKAAGKIPPNPYSSSGTPAVLLIADTSRAAIQAAAAAGYIAVIGLPVMPRMLYRRIGSILQKMRRAGRRPPALPKVGGGGHPSANASVKQPDD